MLRNKLFFANSRWLRVGHARLAFFGGFALGAVCFIVVFVNWRWVRTFVLELSVLFVNFRWVRFGDARCGFFTNLRRAHTGHLASCEFFVNLHWARV